jgi:hypothetical protein
MFRGSELSRLLALIAIAAAGWVAVWLYLRTPPAPAAPDPVVVDGPPQPIRPDTSEEFETVTDKTPLGFRDNAAFAKLLGQARDATPVDLAASARRDIQFGQILARPASYRGVPIHVLGNASRVLRYESPLSKTGWLYEAWVVSDDSQGYPWVCVFEDAPKGLPIGANVSERIVFNGYFLKLMAYQAADKPRFAPLLIGRIGWTPPAKEGPKWTVPGYYWFAAIVAGMFMISLVRWIVQLRRSLAPRPVSSSLRDRPTEEIAPEELNEWLHSVGDEGVVDEDGGGPEGEDGNRSLRTNGG